MSDFELVALGVGDTFSERHHPTCLLLTYEGFHLAIDCPDMYRRVLLEAGKRASRELPLSTINHVLITHVHGDHMNGLEGVAFYKHFVEQRPLHLVTSPEVRSVIWDQRLRAPMERLWNGHAFGEMSFEDYFRFEPLSWTKEVSVGPFRVRARQTRHHVPTSALLIEAGGRTLGYSADTAFDPTLIEFLADADLILHETNLGPAHTAYADLAQLPAEIRDRMRLVHYPDEFDVRGATIVGLEEGQVLRV
jgi:ribonuclease BN (tRNA processing enzyme)